MMESNPVSIEKVAMAFGVSESLIRSRIKEGRIRPISISKNRIYISEEEFSNLKKNGIEYYNELIRK